MLLIIILYIFIIIFGLGLDLMVLASASKFGVPWYTMVHHGIHHGIPYHSLPWCTMTRPCGDTSRLWYDIPWYTMLYHSFLLYTVVNNGIPIPCLPW